MPSLHVLSIRVAWMDQCIKYFHQHLDSIFEMPPTLTLFLPDGLILACMMTSLDKFSKAFDVKKLSQVVDFIDLYSWDLQGRLTGYADFPNPIESDNDQTLTLVRKFTVTSRAFLLLSVVNTIVKLDR